MLFKSPFESLPVPPHQTIWDALEPHAHGASASDSAFVCSVSDRVVSFAQMLAQAECICAGLCARDIQKGDQVVMLHSFNCIEYPVVFFALNRLEVVCSPSSPLFNAQELHSQAAVAKVTVIIAHKALAQVALAAAELLKINFETVVAVSCVYTGKATVVMPRFELDKFLAVAEKFRLEKLLIAPPMALFLAQHLVDDFDLSCVRRIARGGAPLGAEVEALVEKRLNATLHQGFGMAELAGTATYSPLGTKRIGSAGMLMPNTSLRVRCLETGKNLSPNRHGELLFHTPFTDDGFLCSDDVGYIDDDGFVLIVDRIKGLIKYKGHQVVLFELEDVLNSHPSVANSCCVRGFDFRTGEEIPKAYVVLKRDVANETPTSIQAFVATKVAPFKITREVEFTAAIPKTLPGKILRRKLQERENEKLKQLGNTQYERAPSP